MVSVFRSFDLVAVFFSSFFWFDCELEPMAPEEKKKESTKALVEKTPWIDNEMEKSKALKKGRTVNGEVCLFNVLRLTP